MRLLPAARTFSLAAALFLGVASSLQAASYRLAIPPFLPQAEMKAQYGKLAEYLSKASGEEIELLLIPTYLGYWTEVRKGTGHELAFDAAPLIDFRVERQNYTVLAKVTGVISQSLLTRGDSDILEPQELIGRPVATIASPNVAGLSLFEMFSNPMRQPNFKYAAHPREAAEMLVKGQVEAAFIPTPIAIQYPDLNVVTTTRQLPHLALAASPAVPAEVRERLRKALLEADKTPEGRELLEMLNTPGFEAATNAMYKGYGAMLKGTYGY
ncbi:MAG TPA: hypothetical protein ENO16_05970 [Chromatiales bacterium]|nr:hypothetical protein [Chromatiales bacterium]